MRANGQEYFLPKPQEWKWETLTLTTIRALEEKTLGSRRALDEEVQALENKIREKERQVMAEWKSAGVQAMRQYDGELHGLQKTQNTILRARRKVEDALRYIIEHRQQIESGEKSHA